MNNDKKERETTMPAMLPVEKAIVAIFFLVIGGIALLILFQ